MVFKHYIIILLLTLFFSCDKNDPLELDIIILSTQTEKQWLVDVGDWENQRVAVIEYCTKNVGTRKINGWKVFFNVHLINGPQLLAYEGLSYNLDPDEMSKTRSIICAIPEYYGDAYKATLKHVETW